MATPTHARPLHVTATSTALARPAVVDAISVTAGKAVFRDGTSTTAAVYTLKATTALAGNSATVTFPTGLVFTNRIHVTVTGSSASVDLAIR